MTTVIKIMTLVLFIFYVRQHFPHCCGGNFTFLNVFHLIANCICQLPKVFVNDNTGAFDVLCAASTFPIVCAGKLTNYHMYFIALQIIFVLITGLFILIVKSICQ